MAVGATGVDQRLFIIPMLVGFGLMTVSLIWCLAYYAAWDDNFFGMLDLKLFCVSSASQECSWAARDIIAKSGSSVPTYYPVFWWLGLLALGWAFFSRWLHRARPANSR